MNLKTNLLICLLLGLYTLNITATERKKYNFNSEWRLHIGDDANAYQQEYNDNHWLQVTLPHAFNEDEAFKLSIEQLTDTIVWYRKHFRVKEYILGDSTVIGIEITVVPLEFCIAFLFTILPVVVDAYSQDIVALLHIRGKVEAYCHNTVFV